MQHPELGRKILDRVSDTVQNVGKVEFHRQDGRNMIMVLAPRQAGAGLIRQAATEGGGRSRRRRSR
ncbi:MAG: hypothetical protein R2695_18295 [Acidimicrobiales bacterium]